MAVIPSITLGSVAIGNTIISALGSANETMSELTAAYSTRIEYQLQSYINVAETAGTMPMFSDETASAEDKKAVVDSLAKSKGFERGNIIGIDGISIFDGKDYSQRDYFQKAIKGESYISDPLLSKITNKYAVLVAAPIWDEGIQGGKVTGCIYFAPPADFLINIMRSVNLSGDSSVYMINPKGVIIADRKDDTVAKQLSMIEYAGTEEGKEYKELAAIHEKMLAGETGNAYYKGPSGTILISYIPVKSNISGWYLALEEPVSNFVNGIVPTVVMMGILTLAFCLIAAVVAFAISKGIVRPIQACSERIAGLSRGDIKSPAVHIESNDEVGVLARSTEILVNNLRTIISDIDRILSATSRADLSTDLEINSNAYVGDFAEILDSMKNINSSLSQIIRDIDLAATQVSVGSDQVSASAQSLSQGSTEQASSIEQLASYISEIASKTDLNLSDCELAKQTVDTSSQLMTEAHEHMQRMTSAMDRIGSASEKIEKVIKAIEDIAFQTNILALNAAVEAAKVGEAGKGFAVVAGEVRNLAKKSQESAKSTSALIRECSDAVRDGVQISEETAETLDKVLNASTDVMNIVNKVAGSSENQVSSIQNVSQGVDQISAVVQTNSATAEESAAASEELNGQSQILKSLVDKFKLPLEE